MLGISVAHVPGLVILLGICAGDDIPLAQRLAAKACKLRLWDDRCITGMDGEKKEKWAKLKEMVGF